MSIAGQVRIRKDVCLVKYDPVAEWVLMVDFNPQYAYVQLPGGSEEVSFRHQAPCGDQSMENTSELPGDLRSNNLRLKDTLLESTNNNSEQPKTNQNVLPT
ncbi:hypothetical protein P879_04243 [Paragonimus westermani]|uniref:Uncharacterized protein n=1 Tax=Paragonimus westermani TaxID=34504 RepID=A0A8T0D1Y4_9TREM|nr:hypothetical protein P879_04243 [Paragonimus westermani]